MAWTLFTCPCGQYSGLGGSSDPLGARDPTSWMAGESPVQTRGSRSFGQIVEARSGNAKWSQLPGHARWRMLLCVAATTTSEIACGECVGTIIPRTHVHRTWRQAFLSGGVDENAEQAASIIPVKILGSESPLHDRFLLQVTRALGRCLEWVCWGVQVSGRSGHTYVGGKPRGALTV